MPNIECPKKEVKNKVRDELDLFWLDIFLITINFFDLTTKDKILQNLDWLSDFLLRSFCLAFDWTCNSLNCSSVYDFLHLPLTTCFMIEEFLLTTWQDSDLHLVKSSISTTNIQSSLPIVLYWISKIGLSTQYLKP